MQGKATHTVGEMAAVNAPKPMSASAPVYTSRMPRTSSQRGA